MDRHFCDVCTIDAYLHDENCEVGGTKHMHWPPLCCLGCSCGSFEDEHPEQKEQGR
jgi:hypothetical protein